MALNTAEYIQLSSLLKQARADLAAIELAADPQNVLQLRLATAVAEIAADCGQSEEALALSRATLEFIDRRGLSAPLALMHARLNVVRGWMERRSGHGGEAIAALQVAEATQAQWLDASSPRLAQTRVHLAMGLALQGAADEARVFLARARAGFATHSRLAPYY